MCLACNRGIIEDAFHLFVLCECQVHCVKMYLGQLINALLFLNIWNSEKQNILKYGNNKLAKFLIKACNSRRKVLYVDT